MRAAAAAARRGVNDARSTPLRSIGFAAAVVGGGLSLTSTPALGVDLHQSRLTTIELAACNRISGDADGMAWICPGLPGYPVYLAGVRERQMMSFGPEPENRLSARQTLAPENTIFNGKRRPTIEWRLERTNDNRLVPFATIVRYYTSRSSAKGEALVITKVGSNEACRVALIDVRANSNPMALARMWANANVSRMECPGEPVVLGRRGDDPM